MVIAMLLGMAVLGVPAGWALGAMGLPWDQLTDDAPALMFLGMATTMTVPMVGWMIYRGHGRPANAEMSAAMFLLLRPDEYTHHHAHVEPAIAEQVTA